MQRETEIKDGEHLKESSFIQPQTALADAYHKLINTTTDKDILFAANVQKNILHKEGDLKMTFPDSFVLEYPRNTVITSFYWVMNGKNGLKYVAVINCGAQGMQAGFISIATASLLSKAVLEFGMIHPSGILEILDGEIQKTFSRCTNER